ncbi:MAG: sulfatase [Rikenellaceae bacterium]
MKNLHLLTLGTLSLAGCANASAEEPVNILWLWGEDISPWMPLYGDNTVETPYINFLAENGVIYSNCYSTSSVSSPTRSAIITGMMQTSIGAHNHRSGRSDKLVTTLPDSLKTLPQIMRAGGYYAFNNGKDDFNWQYDWDDYWRGTYDEKASFGKFGEGSWKNRTEDVPFFGIIELYGGKGNSVVKVPVDESKIQIPPYYPDSKMIRGLLAKHYNQIISTDNDIKNIIEELKKDGLYENTIIIFLSDNGYLTPRDKQFLYDGGIHMPFVVSAPGNPALLEKYGVKMGERRDQMVSLMDITATTLAMAGVEIPDYMESQNIFDKDYNREYIVAARDRCDFTIDRIRAIRTKDFKYIRNFMTDRPLLQSQYRDTKSWWKEFIADCDSGKYKFADEWMGDTRPAEELYDVVNDPHEIVNLATDPRYAKEMDAMRKRLSDWIEESGDRGQYPETKEQLEVVYERWGERCVNSEYDVVK